MTAAEHQHGRLILLVERFADEKERLHSVLRKTERRMVTLVEDLHRAEQANTILRLKVEELERRLGALDEPVSNVVALHPGAA